MTLGTPLDVVIKVRQQNLLGSLAFYAASQRAARVDISDSMAVIVREDLRTLRRHKLRDLGTRIEVYGRFHSSHWSFFVNSMIETFDGYLQPAIIHIQKALYAPAGAPAHGIELQRCIGESLYGD